MKKHYIIFFFFLCSNSIFSASYENLQLGISLDYPKNWKSVPVLDSNKPTSIFEAIRNESVDEFLTLVVFPTTDLAVDKSRLQTWTNEMSSAFRGGVQNIKSSDIHYFSSGNWYGLLLNLNGNKIIVYNAILNGYSYNITFLTNEINDKKFEQEADQIMISIKLTMPLNIKTVEGFLEGTIKDSLTHLFVPRQFSMSKQLDRKQTAPYVYALYKKLLAENNADYVSVASEMALQLFCFNVKLNSKVADQQSLSLISKIAAIKFKNDGVAYEEISVAPWDKSPETVFLHKFRLTTSSSATTHYIFYLTKGGGMDVFKFQLASNLEKRLEPYFFEMILKNSGS